MSVLSDGVMFPQSVEAASEISRGVGYRTTHAATLGKAARERGRVESCSYGCAAANPRGQAFTRFSALMSGDLRDLHDRLATILFCRGIVLQKRQHLL